MSRTEKHQPGLDPERDRFEAEVVRRFAESGLLEIEVQVECLPREGDGYRDGSVDAYWHFFRRGVALAGSPAAQSIREAQLRTALHKIAHGTCGYCGRTNDPPRADVLAGGRGGAGCPDRTRCRLGLPDAEQVALAALVGPTGPLGREDGIKPSGSQPGSLAALVYDAVATRVSVDETIDGCTLIGLDEAATAVLNPIVSGRIS